MKKLMASLTYICIGLLAASFSFGQTHSNTTGNNISVTVKSLKNSSGKALIYLWDQSSGFPSDKKKTVATKTVSIKKGEALTVFENLQAGKEYAISVMHDENGNGKMDTKAFGIPKEGYATSNNIPHSTFSGPKYKPAKFILKKGKNSVEIKMLY